MDSKLHAPGICFALAVALLSGFASAQDAERPNANLDTAQLEKRLGELERQVEGLLKEIRELRQEIQPLGSGKILVFQLQYIDSHTATKVLKKVFGLSQDTRGPLVIEADAVANSVVVFGPPEKIEMVKEILNKLDRK